MKCPCCNGTGRTPMVTIVKTDSGLPCDFPCIECDGTGEVEMTNEYFLQTATTEQLAEFIVNMTLLDKYKLYDRMESAEYEQGIGIGAKKVIVEWLKEKHNG